MKKYRKIILSVVLLLTFIVTLFFGVVHLSLGRTYRVIEKFENSNTTWICEELQLELYPKENLDETITSIQGKMVIDGNEYAISVFPKCAGNRFGQPLVVEINDEENTTLFYAFGRYNLWGNKFVLSDINWCEGYGENNVKKATLVPMNKD